MKARRAIKLFAVLLVIVFGILAALIAYLPFGHLIIHHPFNKSDLEKKADRVIIGVELYRDKLGPLPNSLYELGDSDAEKGPIYYEKKSEHDYIIWYGKELGESAIYSSKTKKWND